MPDYPTSPYGIEDNYGDGGASNAAQSMYGAAMPPTPSQAPAQPRSSAPAWQTPTTGGMPASDAYERYLEDQLRYRREHPVSTTRKVLGTLASTISPQIGGMITDPGGHEAQFRRNAPIYQAQAKSEEDRLNKQSMIAQRQESEANARSIRDQTRETSLANQEKDTELQPIQQMPNSVTPAPLDPLSPGTKAIQQEPPPLAPPSPTGPVDLMAPSNPIASQDPALAAMRSPSVATGGGRVPLDTSLASPASGGRPAPQGMERVRPTALGVAKQKGQAARAEAKPDIHEMYASAIADALSRGVSPAEDPKVTQLQDSITALQKQPMEKTPQKDDRAIQIYAKPTDQRTPEEQSYLKGYEQYIQKTKVDPSLIRIEAGSDASQGFQEKETGRNLLNKAEGTYRTAAQSADDLMGFIDLARAGNKVAAQAAPLEGTLSIMTSQGVKRINRTEVESIQGAGSLFDQIMGKVGKLTAGQPIPSDIQEDFKKLAALLKTNAYKSYKDTFESAKKRYKLQDEEPIPDPAGKGGGAGGQHTIQIGNKFYKYKGSGNTADMSNYSEVSAPNGRP